MTEPSPDPTGAGDDRLATLRAELDELEHRPVGEHVAVYERANAVLAAELAALDEV